MQIDSRPDAGPVTVTAVAAKLFQQAASAARTELNRDELEALLGTLEVTLIGEVEAAAAASSGELRLSLHHSREFGMVISATAAGL
ncbi:MAG: hypothetical protein WCI45_11860, partial [Desulfuromonadales bacterium]